MRPILGHVHQTIRVFVRERLQQQRIDDAEQRGIRADSQRQRDHRREREAWITAEAAQSVAQILPSHVQEPDAIRLARLFEEQGSIPEAPCGVAASFRFRHAGSRIVPAPRLQVKIDLVIQFTLQLAWPEQVPKSIGPRHGQILLIK
jgi:hypothetical protein